MANSKRKCKQCRGYFPLDTCRKTPAGYFCSFQHASDYALDKSRKQKEQKARREHRKAVMDVKPIGYWMKRAQSAFNAYIRERDKGLPCISCGNETKRGEGITGSAIDAGHYRSSGAHPSLKFEEFNCHAQCVTCNRYKSGALSEYRIGLIHRIGIDKVEWLEGPHEPKRYRKEDYQAIEAEYKGKLKILQK